MELNALRRHCSCVYYQDWHRTKHPRPAAEGTILNAVSSAIAPSTADAHTASANSPRNTLARSTGTVADAGGSEDPSTVAAPTTDGGPKSNALTFDEEAKLVYGVTLTLRNMIKKLSKRCVRTRSHSRSSPSLTPHLKPCLLVQRGTFHGLSHVDVQATSV